MIHIFNNYPNIEVTNYYLDIIEKAFCKLGEETRFVSFRAARKVGKFRLLYNLLFFNFGYKGISKEDWIVVANSPEVVNLWLHGYKNIILWIQGIAPEESYMNNESKISKKILEVLERLAIKYSKFTFMVSNAMKEHYETKYHVDFGERYFIMPCYNVSLDLTSFEYPNKYDNNVFAYVGSTVSWQCFRETITLYKKIEDLLPNSELRLYTSGKEEAKLMCEELGIQSYLIDFVHADELKEKLKSCKFGFIIRDDNVVNNVATPTKLSSYMASGVIPIFTQAIKDFAQNSMLLKNVCLINSFNDSDTIIKVANMKIESEEIMNEYKMFFEKYYNDTNYILNIANKIQNIL